MHASYDKNGYSPEYHLMHGTVPSANYYLDVQRRAASTTLPSSPATFLWDTLSSDTHASHTLATGVTVLPYDAVYTFAFMYNVDASSGTHIIYSAAEVLSGVTWNKLEYSARQVAIRANENNQALYSSTNRFTAGTTIRFPVWADNGVQLIVTESPATGFTIPAARMLITGVL